MKRTFIAVLAVGLSAAWQPAPVAGQTDEIVWRGNVARGDWIEIRGINGSVRAVSSDETVVHVEATLRGRRSDPESVRIDVVEHDDGVTVCAVYPTPARSRRQNECRPGGGSQNVQDNDVEVDFIVRVPAGVNVKGHTVNGDVELEGLRGDAEGTTVNGDVTIETNGFVDRATTVNGAILLTVPDGLNADLHASTVNGTIESDFPITIRGRMGPRDMRGAIGNGGPEIQLSTVNGDIRLRRR